MNREIKFRFWDKENKEMLKTKEGDIGIPLYGAIALYAWNDIDLSKEDLEIMQYTGLKDKNGKEIYEGDILKCERGYWKNTRNLVVEWQDERYGLTDIKNPVDSEIMDRTSIFNVSEGEREVIGNLYENPELLTTPPTEE